MCSVKNDARNLDFNVRIIPRVDTTSQRVHTTQKAITDRNGITIPLKGHQGDKVVLKPNYGLSSVSGVPSNTLDSPLRDEIKHKKATPYVMVYSRFSGDHRKGQPYASEKNCLRRMIRDSPKGIFPCEVDKMYELVMMPQMQVVVKTPTFSTKQHTTSQHPFGPCGEWLKEFRMTSEKEKALNVLPQTPALSFCISCPPQKEKNCIQREKTGSLMKYDRVHSITTQGRRGGDSLDDLAHVNLASELSLIGARESSCPDQLPPSELNVMRSLFSVFLIFSFWKRRDIESIRMNRLLLKAGFAHLQLHWMIATHHDKGQKHVVFARETFRLNPCNLSQGSQVNVSNARPVSFKSFSTTGCFKKEKMDQHGRVSLVIKGRQIMNRKNRRTWLSKFVWTKLQSFQHQKHAMQCRIERLSLLIEDMWASFLLCKNRKISVTALERLNPLDVPVLSPHRKEPVGCFKKCESFEKLHEEAVSWVNVECCEENLHPQSLVVKREQKIQDDILHDVRHLQMSCTMKDGPRNRNLKRLHTDVRKIQAQLRLHRNCKTHFYNEARLRIKEIQQMCHKNFTESQWARCSIADALVALEQSMRDDVIERNGIKGMNSARISSSDSLSDGQCRDDTCASPNILSQSVFHTVKEWRRSAVACLCSFYDPANGETDLPHPILTPDEVSKDPSGFPKNSRNPEEHLMNKYECLAINQFSQASNRNNSRGLPLAKDNIDTTNDVVLPSNKKLAQVTEHTHHHLQGHETPLTVSDSTKVSEGFDKEFHGGGWARMDSKTLQATPFGDKLFYPSPTKPRMRHTKRVGYLLSYREKKIFYKKVSPTGQSKMSNKHSHRSTRYSRANRSHEKHYRHSFPPYLHSKTRIQKLPSLSKLYARARVHSRKNWESKTTHSYGPSNKAFSDVISQHSPPQVIESPRDKSLVNRERFLHEALEKYSSQCQLGFIELYQQRQRLQTILEKLDRAKRKKRKDEASKQCQSLCSQLYRSVMACRWILHNTYLSREESAKNRLKILLELKKTCSAKPSSPLFTSGVMSTYLDIHPTSYPT